MSDPWDDDGAQAQFEREERIWIASAQRRRNSQSSLLWGLGIVVFMIVAIIASLS